MTSLARLSSWRLRLSRLCGLSSSSSSHKQQAKQQRTDGNKMNSGPPVVMEQQHALRDFIERVESMAKNNYFTANLEFARLRNAQESFQVQEEFSMSKGFSAPQNRYRDVVPYNKNRICLKGNDSSNDYINASLIEFPNVARRYIAAQAPLPATIDDFWHMIGQYKVRVVAMLCNVVENSVVKCVQYWPLKAGEQIDLGYGILKTLKEDQFDHFICREILFASKRFGEFTVYQLHYTEWPDHGRPDTDLHIPNFIETIDEYQVKHGGDAPILVHCSAGVGRTGSVIGVDIFRILIRENKIMHRIDLKDFVLTLRMQRTSFVQSASQYQLLHTLVAYYCRLALDKAASVEQDAEPPTCTQEPAQLLNTEQSNGIVTESATTTTIVDTSDGNKDLVADKLSLN